MDTQAVNQTENPTPINSSNPQQKRSRPRAIILSRKQRARQAQSQTRGAANAEKLASKITLAKSRNQRTQRRRAEWENVDEAIAKDLEKLGAIQGANIAERQLASKSAHASDKSVSSRLVSAQRREKKQRKRLNRDKEEPEKQSTRMDDAATIKQIASESIVLEADDIS